MNITRSHQKRKIHLFIYFLFFLLSVLFLSIFSSHTSPLFNTYGGDSAIFIMLGKLFLEGKVPYVDYFDHKGPVLIFFEAFGLLLHPDERISIFIFQIINLFVVQALIFNTARYLVSAAMSLTVAILSLVLFSFTIQGGNMTEEFSLPFSFWSLWVTVKFHFTQNKEFSSRQALLSGIFASVLFWMRPNNAGVICVCIFFILFLYLQRKDYKNISRILLYTTVGFIFISLLIFLYFYKIDALNEMLYASIEFNLKYIYFTPKTPYGNLHSIILHIIKGWTPFIVLTTGVILYYRKTKDFSIIILALFLFLTGVITTHIGLNYYHYMTLNIPLFVLGLSFIFKACSNIRSSIALPIAFILLFGYSFMKYNDPEYRESQDDSGFIKSTSEVMSFIPQAEHNSIYTYNIPAKFWLITGLLPSYKYFIHQDWHGLHSPAIYQEINMNILENPPKWIVIPNISVDKDILNISFYEILERHYSLRHKNEDFILYNYSENKKDHTHCTVF